METSARIGPPPPLEAISSMAEEEMEITLGEEGLNECGTKWTLLLSPSFDATFLGLLYQKYTRTYRTLKHTTELSSNPYMLYLFS